MRILLTGGSGAVGRYVARELLAGGHTLTVFDLVRPTESNEILWIEGDLLDAGAVAHACEGHDAISHLAAIPNPEAADASTVMTVNVTGTLNVFSGAVGAGVSNMAYASADSALGFTFRT